MSTVTAKEKNMLMVIVVLVLYAAAALFYRKQEAEWKKHANVLKSVQKKYAQECALIEAGKDWDDKYTTMRSLMPVFPYDKDVATHWLNMMDTVASEHKLVISRRQLGKEEEVGDVFELPIDCKNWDGTLDSLVGFLYGLHAEGAMLDVRQLFVRPAANQGYLRGTFSLYCAYMRGDVVEEDSDAGSAVALRPAMIKKSLKPDAVDPVAPQPVAMDATAVPEIQPKVSKEAVKVPASLTKEQRPHVETTEDDDTEAQQDLEAAAVKAALEALKKRSE